MKNQLIKLNKKIITSRRSFEMVMAQSLKKVCALFALFIILVGCNNESAPDCLQNSGDLVREEVLVADFDKITVFENVSLVLKQGDEQKVEVETGEFLYDEVSTEVKEGRLLLRDTNDCNYFRDYGLTTIYVTSPNITEIRSSTGWGIESDGVLAYANLSLISESFINPQSETTDGEYNLQLNSQSLSVVVNGIAYFQLSGTVENLSLNIAAGDSRIEADKLTAQNVSVNHRGSNDMLVNPQASIRGAIRSTGNVISKNRPNIIEVQEIYKGRLRFE